MLVSQQHPSALEYLAARATLTWLSNCIRRGQVSKRRRSFWRSYLRNHLSPQMREMLLEMVLPEGRLCDTVQFILLDILFCSKINKLELRYVRTWYQEPLAKMILSWRTSGVKKLLLEDASWLGVDCCPRSPSPTSISTSCSQRAPLITRSQCNVRKKKAKDLWATSDRAVLVFDTPAPPCPCRLLPYLISAMPALTQVHLKYICDDGTLEALGRYCHQLAFLDCSWSPRVTNNGVALLSLSLPSDGRTNDLIPTRDSWVFPEISTKKPKKCWRKLTATLAFRFSDIFVPVFSKDEHQESRATISTSWPLMGAKMLKNGGQVDFLRAVVDFAAENPEMTPDVPLTRCLETQNLRIVNFTGTGVSTGQLVISFFDVLAPFVEVLA